MSSKNIKYQDKTQELCLTNACSIRNTERLPTLCNWQLQCPKSCCTLQRAFNSTKTEGGKDAGSHHCFKLKVLGKRQRETTIKNIKPNHQTELPPKLTKKPNGPILPCHDSREPKSPQHTFENKWNYRSKHGQDQSVTIKTILHKRKKNHSQQLKNSSNIQKIIKTTFNISHIKNYKTGPEIWLSGEVPTLFLQKS